MSETTTSFPTWLRKRISANPTRDEVLALIEKHKLATVCQEAHCPNLSECFCRRHATFMILGNVCTRNCQFCAVQGGMPVPPDPEEPVRVAEAARILQLKHVVITSVTRDDLKDGGASHFAATIQAVRSRCSATVEVLIPDFGGNSTALRTVMAACPDVLNHNVETVRSLYPSARPQADYERSLAVLKKAREFQPGVVTKSGLMVGMGETREELEQVFHDLAAAGCEILTIGQYLRPSRAHLPVARFLSPDEFEELSTIAQKAGIPVVIAGPFVRSSYEAGEAFARAKGLREREMLCGGDATRQT